MHDLLRSELFWAAFGGIIALVALLWTPIGSLIPYFRKRRLQHLLIAERKFFESNPPVGQTDQVTRYIGAVKNALQTISKLGPADTKIITENLRRLIGELRATHVTLANTMKPFRMENATKFLEVFDDIIQDFDTLWLADGRYRHEVRTHCGQVEMIVGQILSEFKEPLEANQESIRDLQQIGWSMTHLDNEIIVPVMDEILVRTKADYYLIKAAIRSGNQTRAIRFKEKLRFDTDNLFLQLNSALEEMNRLEARL